LGDASLYLKDLLRSYTAWVLRAILFIYILLRIPQKTFFPFTATILINNWFLKEIEKTFSPPKKEKRERNKKTLSFQVPGSTQSVGCSDA